MHTHRAPVANPPTDLTCPSCGAPYAREPGRSGLRLCRKCGGTVEANPPAAAPTNPRGHRSRHRRRPVHGVQRAVGRGSRGSRRALHGLVPLAARRHEQRPRPAPGTPLTPLDVLLSTVVEAMAVYDASAGHTHPPDVLAPECRVCHMLIALTRGLPPDYIDKLRNLTAQRKAAR